MTAQLQYLAISLGALLLAAPSEARAETAADETPAEEEAEQETSPPPEQPETEPAKGDSETALGIKGPAKADSPGVEGQDHSAAVARVVSGSRVGAGLLVGDGSEVVVLFERVRLGYVAKVQLGNGHRSSAWISVVDKDRGLALLELDEPAPRGIAAHLRTSPPASGEVLTAIGHGGSVGLPPYEETVRGLANFSSITTRVTTAPPTKAPETDPRTQDFLVDRVPGSGDKGAPLFDAEGKAVGLLRTALPEGGGRGLAVSAQAITELLAGERLDRPYRRPHHLQSWGGMVFATHNRPAHFAGGPVIGLRAVFFDALRLEPWFEVDLGWRAASGEEEARPEDFWWALQAGLSVGYRIPVFGEDRRDYLVPNVGLRVGWHTFQHQDDYLVANCPTTGACRWTTEGVLDAAQEVRVGVDLGIDLRHKNLRLGYRFFIDPANIEGHSMHRIVFTVDGLPLPMTVGDSS